MKRTSQPVAIGIDVAKSSLSVCVRFRKGTERALSLRNTEADIKKRLLPFIQDCTGKTVMESTGHYHFLVALLLSEAGVDVRVVNPILAKQYTSASVRKVKTDPADASGLARMAEVADNLPPSFSFSREALFLRKKLGLIASLGRQLQAAQAALTSVEEAREILGRDVSEAVSAIRTTVLTLRKEVRSLERECVAEAKRVETVRERAELLETIPGVSEFGAVLSLQWFAPGKTAKSFVAYAGLDISSRESGTWKGTCRLTKRGNAFLRARLYASAWGAVMNDDSFRSYYDCLRREEGRAHVEALTIIARKIIHIMHRILETGLPYDPSKFSHKYLGQVST
ncbi:MAG: IS110 family transposase [Candidatus Moraniibacteriota bacterium]